MADREQVDLSAIVDQLCATPDLAERLAAHADQELPARATVGRSVEGIRSALFPGYFGLVHLGEGVRFHVAALLEASLRELRRQSVLAMRFVGRAESEAATAVDRLLHRLPELKRMLLLDVEAAYTGDPAARSRDEAIFSYPGVQAIIFHRIAHELQLAEVPFIPRIISEEAHSATGIEIHPGAQIGERFFIDHGTGVVIGETCEIGDRVRMYQNATLGAKSYALDPDGQPVKGIPRHPIVGDDVIIYSGATILGRTRIGNGPIIGANAWVTRDVEAGALVTRRHGEDEDLRLDTER